MEKTTDSSLTFTKTWIAFPTLFWHGEAKPAADPEGIRKLLLMLDQPLWAVALPYGVGLAAGGEILPAGAGGLPVLAYAPPLLPQQFGSPAFCAAYGTRYALYGGAMANAISSEDMVIALAKAGMLGSFGAAGLSPQRLEAAIQRIQAALPEGNYAFNLINSPSQPSLEQRAAELYLQYGIHTVEASAYVDITTSLVHYRAAGLEQLPDGEILPRNRIIAKLSRKEVARRFMEPAPPDILQTLLADGRITPQQAKLAQYVPMADDITVEADSGGHTDNRPLVGLLPTMLALRDEIQAKRSYRVPVRVGAGGGIGAPASALAAFMMGAAYVVTGSVNHACIESGASEHTRSLLAQADMADVIMAPSADMFEMGVKVQVLKRGTLFPMRAAKLYELYTRYDSVEQIPPAEREKLEKQIFKRSLEEIWLETEKFFSQRDPDQIERANANPKYKMALIFRWYLGLSSRWSVSGEKGREMDYQIWCGPAMGIFNEWVHNTYLAQVHNRRVVDVNLHILTGAAYLFRLRMLQAQGLAFPSSLEMYYPQEPLI